jgi:hypothetical protein
MKGKNKYWHATAQVPYFDEEDFVIKPVFYSTPEPRTIGGDIMSEITRLEVIEPGIGRYLVKYFDKPITVTYDLQDDGKTIKIFINAPEWGKKL